MGTTVFDRNVITVNVSVGGEKSVGTKEKPANVILISKIRPKDKMALIRKMNIVLGEIGETITAERKGILAGQTGTLAGQTGILAVVLTVVLTDEAEAVDVRKEVMEAAVVRVDAAVVADVQVDAAVAADVQVDVRADVRADMAEAVEDQADVADAVAANK